MQGLARFSFISVIFLAAFLLLAWAYLSLRYGGIGEFLDGEGPRYWRADRGEAYRESGDAPEEGKDDAKDGVKPPDLPPDETGEWRRVPSEKTSEPAKEGQPSRGDFVEATLDDAFREPSIETENETLNAASREHRLKPFFARTRPLDPDVRTGRFDDQAIELFSKPSRWNDELKQAMARTPMRIFHGKVTDKYKRKPVSNVVIAPVDAQTGMPSMVRAVTNDSGRYVLLVPELMIETLSSKKDGLQFAVIADGFAPEGAKNSSLLVPAKRLRGGEQDFELKPDRGVRVRVTLTNLKFSSEPVRLWCEFRASTAGALYDDAIFASIDAPANGSVVFRFPHAIAGTFRIGAGGNGCSSDVLETEKIKDGTIAATLTLKRTRTYYMRGEISGFKRNDPRKDSVARVESLPWHDVSYADSSGKFEFSVRLSEEREPTLIQVSYANRLEREFELDEATYAKATYGFLRVTYLPENNTPWWFFEQRSEVTFSWVELPADDYNYWGNEHFKVLAISQKGEREIAFAGGRKGATVIEFNGIRWGTDTIEVRDPNAAKDQQVVAAYRILRRCWTHPTYASDGKTLLLEVERVVLDAR